MFGFAPKEAGVYRIRNLVTNKFYIGSSVNLAARKRTHVSDLKNNRHHAPYLQNSWNKHGGDVFVFEILQLCQAEETVVAEQWWIDNSNHSYNVLPTAGSTLGHKWSMDQRIQHAVSNGTAFEYNGRVASYSILAEEHGIPIQRLWRRVEKQGMSIEQALRVTNEQVFAYRAKKGHASRTPEQKKEIAMKLSSAQKGKVIESRRKKYTVFGEELSLYDIAEKYEIDFEKLKGRISRGISAEECIKYKDIEDLREIPERKEMWLERLREAAKDKAYTPMSPEMREKQREAVREYNKNREITDEMRKKMSDAHKNKASVERFDVRGTQMTVLEIAEAFGLDRHVVRKRINAGWDMEKVITTPARKLTRKNP